MKAKQGKGGAGSQGSDWSARGEKVRDGVTRQAKKKDYSPLQESICLCVLLALHPVVPDERQVGQVRAGPGGEGHSKLFDEPLKASVTPL